MTASHATILALILSGLRSLAQAAPAPQPESWQSTGVKIGEVTDASAIIWVRLTEHSQRNAEGLEFIMPKPKPGEKATAAPAAPKPDGNPSQWRGACPGAQGKIRLRWSTEASLAGARESPWSPARSENDYSCQIRLTGLKPDTEYHFVSEAVPDGKAPGERRGKFRTAPAPDKPSALTFCVVTCQGYKDLDAPDGFKVYDALAKEKPAFVVFTGDNVYYDNDPPKVTRPDMARYHWERMFSLPRHDPLLSAVPSYWMKDDHDAYADNCDATKGVKGWTYEDGRKIFLQQTPQTSEKTFRTFRWGRDLQVWLLEGRDHRSPNIAPDGPKKSLLGAEQKQWLFDTVKASTAKWKILICPESIAGPGSSGKAGDNLASASFKTEGDEVRSFLQRTCGDSVFNICGDFHAQHHSVNPQSGLNEFSVGPTSDQHTAAMKKEPSHHLFTRKGGGYLSVTLTPQGAVSDIRFQLHDVSGKSVYEWKGPPSPPLKSAPPAAPVEKKAS